MSDSAQLVSIVLPVHNGERYLKEAINSCLQQTHPALELIVVDDASTDATSRIIASYSDPRITVIHNKLNQSLPGALNTGFARARGDYLTWTSDDNILMPNTIEKLLDFLLRSKSQFVYADFFLFKDDISSAIPITLSPEQDLSKRNDVGPCFLYTHKVMETIGQYDTEAYLSEDYDYWIRVSKQFRLDHLCAPLYYYRDHPDSLTVARSLEVKATGALVLVKNKMLDDARAVEYIIEALIYSQYPTKNVRLNKLLLARLRKSLRTPIAQFRHHRLSLPAARVLLVSILKKAKNLRINI